MKTLFLWLLVDITTVSCSTVEYNTRHQARTLHQFSRSRHGKPVSIKKQTVYTHPAVNSETRKILK